MYKTISQISLPKTLVKASPGVEIIINNASGAQNKAQIVSRLEKIFAARKTPFSITVAENGAEVVELARRAVEGKAETIVAGGGDGTISAVATALVGTDKTLGVLPLGTFNYFARNHQIPLRLEQAIENILENHVVSVNVGEVNGRVFINNSSIGIYPSALRRREQTYRRWGRNRFVAYFPVISTVLRSNPFHEIHLGGNGSKVTLQTPLVFVVINQYQQKTFGVFNESSMKADELAFYVSKPVKPWKMFELTLRIFLRRLKTNNYQFFSGAQMQLETPETQLFVAADGEVRLMTTPLEFRLRRNALRLITPPKPSE